MHRFILLSTTLTSLMSVSACVTSPIEKPTYKSETLVFSSASRGQEKSVVAMIATPFGPKDKLPLIITQHGSNRDGVIFPGGVGRTDEYSSRLMREGTKRGFAVAALDAFYKTSLDPLDKGKFPNAHNYALDLKEILAKDQRFDPNNFFYTGFSYGAGQVNKSVDIRTDFKFLPWRAIAAAEPGCNIISEPAKVPFPVLMIKGSESHYHIEPCQYFARLLKSAGVSIELTIIEGANHFFSTDGRIVEGKAVNGCRFNPVIRKKDRFEFADGTPATRASIRQKCFTKTGGAGKNRLLLDGVIERVLRYFDRHKT